MLDKEPTVCAAVDAIDCKHHQTSRVCSMFNARVGQHEVSQCWKSRMRFGLCFFLPTVGLVLQANDIHIVRRSGDRTTKCHQGTNK